MKAIVFKGDLRLARDYPAPRPAMGEALVKIRIAGICNTDLEIIKGYAGFTGVLGHEFVGTVEDVHGGGSKLIGKRVVGDINIGCGKCEYCVIGLKEHCPGRKVLGIQGKDGAMAEYVTLPAANLHIVPDAVADEEAVFTEPLAAAFEILNQIHFRPVDKVLVLGDGKLGLLISMVLSRIPLDLTLAGKHESKLAIVRARKVKTISLGRLGTANKFDIVVDATGSPGGFETALGLVKPRGTLVLKSTFAGKGPMNLFPVVVHEITIVGSRCGPFAPAIGAIADGTIDVMPLITKIFPADSALEAFAFAGQKGSLKVLLDFR